VNHDVVDEFVGFEEVGARELQVVQNPGFARQIAIL
jgi:hypothetical protein